MDQFSGGYYHRQSYTSRSTTPIRQQPQMNQYPQRRDRSRPRDYVMSNRPSQYQTQQKPYPPPPRQRNPSPYRRAPPPGKFSRNPAQPQPSYNSYNQGQPYEGQSYEKRQSYSPTPSRNQIFQQFRGRQEKEQRTAVEREESYNIRFMKEREAEIQDINSKVKKVNEIYADLAGLIDGQQDLIDQVDMAIEEANTHTKEGVTNYEQARLVFENPISEDLFGDKIGRDRPKTPREEDRRRLRNARDRNRRSREASYQSSEFDCKTPFETIHDDLKEVLKDVKTFGNRVFLACTAPSEGQYNEYATYR